MEREGTWRNALYLELYRGAAMSMHVRGWRRERVTSGLDTTGRSVSVVTGLTIDQHGRLVAAMAIGDGPTLVLDGDVSQLTANIASTMDDLGKVRAVKRRGGS